MCIPINENVYLVVTISTLQDLEGKIIVDELRQEVISTNSKAEPPQCTSLAWSADGQVFDAWLFKGGCLNDLLVPDDYTHSLLILTFTADSPANMRGTRGRTLNVFANSKKEQDVVLTYPPISSQTLFAGYTDNLIRVWQVTIGTR